MTLYITTTEHTKSLKINDESWLIWTPLVERLFMRGQAGGQNWERMGRAAARGRVRTVGTTADVVGRTPQKIFGSYLLWKQDFLDN